MPPEQALRRVLEDAPFVPRRLYASDQARCAELAAELACAWGLELELSRALREMHFGVWEGRLYDDIAREDALRWSAWCEGWKHLAPPEGESLPSFETRISAWVSQKRPCSETLIVTHAGVIRALDVLAGRTWDEVMSREYPYLTWRKHVVPRAAL